MPAPFDFFGQSQQDSDNIQANTARLFNCYLSDAGDGKAVMKSCLGMATFATLTGIACRAMERVDGIIYAVHGGRLWRVSQAGAATNLGAIADSAETTISGNNGKVTICAGGRYYVWDGATLTEPTTGAFANFGSVTFLGQLTVLTEANGRRVQWSEVADPETLNGLSFATTETRDDDNVRAMVFGSELWIFKTRSIERWAQDGAGLYAIPGAVMGRGIKAFGLLTEMDEGGFFIGSDNRAYIVGQGGAMQVVSNAAVQTSIKQDDPQTCFYYQDEGAEFCVITFLNRPAWCFDMSIGAWHERGEAEYGAWTATQAVSAYNNFYVGTTLGAVNILRRNNVDTTGPMIRRAVGRTLDSNGQDFTVSLLQIRGRAGFTSNPTMMLRVSRDRGATWGAPREVSMGAIGQTDARAIWRMLGRGEYFTPEISMSDPRECPIETVAMIEVG